MQNLVPRRSLISYLVKYLIDYSVYRFFKCLETYTASYKVNMFLACFYSAIQLVGQFS